MGLATAGGEGLGTERQVCKDRYCLCASLGVLNSSFPDCGVWTLRNLGSVVPSTVGESEVEPDDQLLQSS